MLSVAIYRIYTFFVKKQICKNISNSIIRLLNDGEKSDYFDDEAVVAIEYAKTKNANRHEITDCINNYIDIINKSIIAKINNIDKEYHFYSTSNYANKAGYVYYKHLAENNRDMLIYGLDNAKANFIIKKIIDADIENYKNGTLKEKLNKQLQKILLYESGKWYIDSNIDKHIELPYNVYIDYVSNKREFKNDIKKILNIEIKPSELKKITKKFTNVDMKYEFENTDGNIVKGNKNLGIKVDENNQYIIDIYTISSLYSLYGNYAELTFGQHDYDEAYEESLRNSDFTPLPSSDDIAAWEKELEEIEKEKRRVFEEESKKYSK